MRNHVSFPSGKARTFNTTVGPAHDPYSRQTTEVCIDHQPTLLLVMCGLAGAYVEVIRASDDKSVFYYDRGQSDEADEAVLRYTGQSFDFWVNRVWGKLDAARYRTDPLMYEAEREMERAYRGYV